MVAPALRPREVWRMRLDEAVLMLAARASLQQPRQSGGSQGSAPRYTEGPGGTRIYAIDSMEKLTTFLGTGRV